MEHITLHSNKFHTHTQKCFKDPKYKNPDSMCTDIFVDSIVRKGL